MTLMSNRSLLLSSFSSFSFSPLSEFSINYYPFYCASTPRQNTLIFLSVHILFISPIISTISPLSPFIPLHLCLFPSSFFPSHWLNFHLNPLSLLKNLDLILSSKHIFSLHIPFSFLFYIRVHSTLPSSLLFTIKK